MAKKHEEGNFKNGKKDGKWIEWLENGDIKSEQMFQDNQSD